MNQFFCYYGLFTQQQLAHGGPACYLMLKTSLGAYRMSIVKAEAALRWCGVLMTLLCLLCTAQVFADQGDISDNEGGVDLVAAVLKGDHNSVASILEEERHKTIFKANLNKALLIAASKGYTKIVELLLANGSEVEASRNHGMTALMEATISGHINMIHVLIAHGANVNGQEQAGVTALIIAAYNGNTDIIQLLLTNGANINHARNDGETALMAASSAGYDDVVDFLLDHGALISSEDHHGLRNMRRAKVTPEGHTEVVDALAHELSGQDASGELLEEASYENYKVRIFRKENGDGHFVIYWEGKPIYIEKGYLFHVGHFDEDEGKNPIIPMGTDITGDGVPNLVVSEWTGGAHCCLVINLFNIGENFSPIQSVNAWDSYTRGFRNLDSDPSLELAIYDFTFRYWLTSFAQSPAPEVLLKYQDQQYRLAGDLMRRPGLSEVALDKLANEIKLSDEWQQHVKSGSYVGTIPPVRLWAKMLNLIYTGNMSQAWALVDLAWPEGMEAKEIFLDAFKKELEGSPYWADLQKLNGKG